MTVNQVPAMGRWDSLGMVASCVCVAHCVALPVLLPLLAAGAMGSTLGFVSDEHFHRMMAAVVIGIAMLAFVPGYRRHRRAAVFAMALSGLTLLLTAAFYSGPWINESRETALTILGGGMMVTTHWLNRRFCRTCSACQSESPGCCDATG
jgi:cytochrome c biogenesis factor